MILPITTDETILRAPNALVAPEEVQELIKTLEESLGASSRPGAGLAAPQIGIHKRIAIIRTDETSLDIVNPVILDKLRPFVNKEEGCLSIPNQKFDVQRYEEIFMKDYLHPDGLILTGFEAIVCQHEIDHTDSVLVKDRAIGKNKIGRNDPCPCGKVVNGKQVKFKKCHGK